MEAGRRHRLKGAACWLTRCPEGRRAASFSQAQPSRAVSSASPRPLSIATAAWTAARPEHTPGHLFKGPRHRHTALGHRDPASTWDSPGAARAKPGRWVPGRPAAARSPGRRGARGPGREQGRPRCGQAGLASPVKEDGHASPWPRSRTRCQGQQGWAQTLGLDWTFSFPGTEPFCVAGL